MEFLVLGYDGEDDDALDRRLSVRDRHIALSDEAVERGEQVIGAAMLNDDGNMKGSAMIVDFPSRAELDEWLKTEPYVTADVWQKIEVIPCKIGPSFQHVKRK